MFSPFLLSLATLDGLVLYIRCESSGSEVRLRCELVVFVGGESANKMTLSGPDDLQRTSQAR